MNKRRNTLNMELSVLTQQTENTESLLTQIPSGLFLLSENLHSFLSRKQLISTPIIYCIRNF